PADRAAFFLCGADVPADIAELTTHIERRRWTRDPVVDNDTFALLRAGTDRTDAVAVVCGAGINCVGRNAAGDVARYPALGWETGDWGGAEAVGREALHHANRAADGRGEPTALVELVERHFGMPALQLGIEIHYRRLRDTRLGELAAGVVAAADEGDVVALRVERAFRDLGLDSGDVVLGGGMLRAQGAFHARVVGRLAAGARPVVPELPPVAGAVLAALDSSAANRFRTAFRGWEPRG